MEKIDFFGNKISLNLNKEEKIRTKIGGCLTILTSVLIITFTFVLGIDIIFREKPITNTFSQILKESTNFTLKNQTENYFGFSLQDFYGTNLNVDGYFEMDVFTSKVNFAANITESELERRIIKYEKCDESDFKIEKDRKTDADWDYLKGLFCLRYENLPIAGTWTEDALDYLTIQVRICKDDAPLLPVWDDPYLGKNNSAQYKNKCKPFDEIKRYIKEEEISFNIYYFDKRIKIQDYSNPVKKSLKNNYFYFTPYSLTLINSNLHNNVIQNDDVFFTFEDKNITFYSIEQDSQIIKPLMEDETILLKWELNSTNYQNNYIRRYIKITEILAFIGGFAKFFSVIFYFINKQFTYFKKCEQIIERIFSLFREGEYDINRINHSCFPSDLNNVHTKRTSKSSIRKVSDSNYYEKKFFSKIPSEFKLTEIKENFDDIDYEIAENALKKKISEYENQEENFGENNVLEYLKEVNSPRKENLDSEIKRTEINQKITQIPDINKVIKFKGKGNVTSENEKENENFEIKEEEKEYFNEKLNSENSEKINIEKQNEEKSFENFAEIDLNIEKKASSSLKNQEEKNSKSNKKLNFIDDIDIDEEKVNTTLPILPRSDKSKKSDNFEIDNKDYLKRNYSVLTLTFNDKNKTENIKILKKKISLRQKELKIKMSFKEIWEYVKEKLRDSKICKFGKEEKDNDVKIKLFKLAEERILQFCDISRLINLQTAFENLEKVVLNDMQISAMKLLQKPVLTSDLNLNRALNLVEEENIDGVIDYFDEKAKNHEENELDERIIKLICQ